MITITITRPGPLMLRLRMHEFKRAAIVEGFNHDDNYPDCNEIEQHNEISEGDILVSINGIRLEDVFLQEILDTIVLCKDSLERTLTFRKDSTLKFYFVSRWRTNENNDFKSLIRCEFIDNDALKTHVTSGLPDGLSCRGLVWRKLLGYLPSNIRIWSTFLRKKREAYNLLIADRKVFTPPQCGDSSVAMMEDKEAMLMDEIQKDVMRTHTDINFFNDCSDIHRNCLERILFTYAVTNPRVRYVQGMNEVCGTLYYVFASDECEEFRSNAEADTFYCMSLLLDEVQDLYIRDMDCSSSGICGVLLQLNDLLHEQDSHVAQLLQHQGIELSFFALRWITTFLSREFDMLDTIHIWDCMFAQDDRTSFLLHMCCVMIASLRDQLLTGDFSSNLHLLQSFPPCDVRTLLLSAVAGMQEEEEAGQSSSSHRLPKLILENGTVFLQSMRASGEEALTTMTSTISHQLNNFRIRFR